MPSYDDEGFESTSSGSRSEYTSPAASPDKQHQLTRSNVNANSGSYIAPIPSVDSVEIAIEKVLAGGVWKKVPDPRSGKSYYYHSITKQTTWDLAKELGFSNNNQQQAPKKREASRGGGKDLDALSDVGVPKLTLAPRTKSNMRAADIGDNLNATSTSFGNMPFEFNSSFGNNNNNKFSLEAPHVAHSEPRTSSGSSGLPPDPLLQSSRRWGGAFGSSDMGFNDSKAVAGMRRRGGAGDTGMFGSGGGGGDDAGEEDGSGGGGAAGAPFTNESLMPEEDEFGGLQTYVAFGSPAASPLMKGSSDGGRGSSQPVVPSENTSFAPGGGSGGGGVGAARGFGGSTPYESDFEGSDANSGGDVEAKMMEKRQQRNASSNQFGALGAFSNTKFRTFSAGTAATTTNNGSPDRSNSISQQAPPLGIRGSGGGPLQPPPGGMGAFGPLATSTTLSETRGPAAANSIPPQGSLEIPPKVIIATTATASNINNSNSKKPSQVHLAVDTDSDSAFSSVGGAGARIAEEARRKAEEMVRKERQQELQKEASSQKSTTKASDIQIAIPTVAAVDHIAPDQRRNVLPLGTSNASPAAAAPSSRQGASVAGWQTSQPILPNTSSLTATSVPPAAGGGLSAQHLPSQSFQQQMATALAAQQLALAPAAPAANSELLQTAEALERLVKAFVTLKDGDSKTAVRQGGSSSRHPRGSSRVGRGGARRQDDDEEDFAAQLHAAKYASLSRMPEGADYLTGRSGNPRATTSVYQPVGNRYLMGHESTTRPTAGSNRGTASAQIIDAIEKRKRHHHAVVKSTIFRKTDGGDEGDGFENANNYDEEDVGEAAFAQHCAMRDATNENSSALEEEILDAVLAMMMSSPKAQSGSKGRSNDRRQAGVSKFEDAPEYMSIAARGGGDGTGSGAARIRGVGGDSRHQRQRDELVSNVVGVEQFQCYSSTHNARAGLSTGVPRSRFAAGERFIEPIDALDDITTAFYRDSSNGRGGHTSQTIECTDSETPSALSNLLEENLQKYLLRHIPLSRTPNGEFGVSPHLGKMILLDLLRVCLDVLVTRFPGNGRKEGGSGGGNNSNVNSLLPINRRDPIVIVYEGPQSKKPSTTTNTSSSSSSSRASATYGLQEACKRTITCLPFEPLEANSNTDLSTAASESASHRKPRYRLEHWVTKGHMWAMVHSLQWSLRKLERITNDPYHAFFHSTTDDATNSTEAKQQQHHKDPIVGGSLDMCDASVLSAEIPLFSLAPASLIRSQKDEEQLPSHYNSRETNFDGEDPRHQQHPHNNNKKGSGGAGRAGSLFNVDEDQLEVLAFAASSLGTEVYRDISTKQSSTPAAGKENVGGAANVGGGDRNKDDAAADEEENPLLVPPSMPQGMRQDLAMQMVVETIQELLADTNIAASVKRRAAAKVSTIMADRDAKWVERRKGQMEENRLAANLLAQQATSSGMKPSPAAVRQAATSAAALQKAKEKAEERRRAETTAVEDRIGKMIDRMKEEVSMQATR